ncbi:MAG: hypothetical protein QXO15_12360 [Nitrososphaerota archaeon]
MKIGGLYNTRGTYRTVFGINVDHKVALIKCIRENLGKDLRVGDIILEVDGQEPIDSTCISSAIMYGKSLKIYREGKIIEK